MEYPFLYLVGMCIASIGLYAYVSPDPERLTHTQVLLLSIGVLVWPLLLLGLVIGYLINSYKGY